MEIKVKDRQSLIDIAIIALGSAEGVFSLVKRNGLSLTDTLTDGQVLEYEADDIVAPPFAKPTGCANLHRQPISAVWNLTTSCPPRLRAKLPVLSSSDLTVPDKCSLTRWRMLWQILWQDGHRKKTRRFTSRVFSKIRLMILSHNLNFYLNEKYYAYPSAAA